MKGLTLPRRIAGSLLALVVACGGAAAANAAQPPLTLPALTGKAAVGAQTLHVTDRSRSAGFGRQGRRELMVEITYPRASRAGCKAAPYAPAPILRRLGTSLSVKDAFAVGTRACAGGVVAAGRHPVIVFSHAYAGTRALYAGLTEDLASHGYIVASTDHTSEAFAVRFPGGRVVDGLYGGPLASRDVTPAETGDLEAVRSKDVSVVLSSVFALGRDRSTVFFGHVDPLRSGVAGHSLGGATALDAVVRDHRFDAAANLDGEVWRDQVAAGPGRTPVLLLLSEGVLRKAFAFTEMCRYLRAARGPKPALLLAGAQHFSYSDLEFLAPQIANRDPSWALPYRDLVGTVDPARAVQAERLTLARFFDAYLAVRPPTRAPELARRPLLVPQDRASLACAKT